MTLSLVQTSHQPPVIIDKLIEKGQPSFGVFARVQHINYLDYYSYLRAQKPLPNWRKELKVNQFCFVQIIQAPYRICLALATIKVVSSAFVYIYNEDTEQLEVCEALQPLTRHASFIGDHYQGQMSLQHRKLTLKLTFSPMQVMIDLDSRFMALRATLERQAQPLAICTPTGRRGWTFTQKEPLAKVFGYLAIKDNCKFDDLDANKRHSNGTMKPIEFSTNSKANLDWTLGYMRHETNWFWSCINSYLPDGRHLLLNLSMGVNETGNSENACWLDGEIIYLPPVLFWRAELPLLADQCNKTMKAIKTRKTIKTSKSSKADKMNKNYDAKNLQPWRIYHQNLGWSTIGIELTFTPIKVYKKTDNFAVVASIFEQWLGEYSGEIRLADESIYLDKVFGLAEDHFAKW